MPKWPNLNARQWNFCTQSYESLINALKVENNEIPIFLSYFFIWCFSSYFFFFPLWALLDTYAIVGDA